MKFTPNSNTGSDSYEKPKPGNYTGVLIGFADIGTHDGAYGPKHRVMLRWELHKRRGPSLDSAGHIHTIVARYTASLNAKATLREVVEAHVGSLTDGSEANSHEWLGTAAKLTLKPSDDEKWINVATVAPLDPEEDDTPRPTLPLEHWEPTEGVDPPNWAKGAWEASQEGGGKKKTSGRAPVPVGAGGGGSDDEDIPF